MENVSVWWDMESCPLPSQMDPFVVISMAKKLFENFNIGGGSEIGHQFNAYKYPSEKEEDIELGQTMVNSGINLQLIHPGNSNEIEKMITVDVLLWAMDVPQPGDIIFIVGNVDFSYLFHKLQERSFNVFLVCVSVGEMPYDMLTAAKDCLEWLTFLELSGQNEENLQFSSILHGYPEQHQDFSNTYSSSASTVSNSTKEWEDNQNMSNFSYIPEDYLTGQSSFNNEWEDNQNMSNFSYIPEDSFSGQSSLTNEWDWSPFSIPPLNESATVTGQQPQSPGFQDHGNQSTRKPMDPAGTKQRNWKSPPITGRKKASVHEFKAWFRQAVNCKERETGYDISYICTEFEKATGKILDFNIMNLLQQCKDIAEVKEVKRGLHLAFPVKTNKQKPFKTRKPNPNPKPKIGKPENSPSGVNCNPNLQTNRKRNSNPKPKAKSEAERKSMPKASAADFHDFLLHMVNRGEFSQGFPMSQIHKRFEFVSGKCLDIQHLGYQELIDLIKVYGSLVAVDETRQGQLRLYPAGFLKETISNSYSRRKNEEIPVNKVKNVANHEAKLEMNRPYTGGGFQTPQNQAWKDDIS